MYHHVENNVCCSLNRPFLLNFSLAAKSRGRKQAQNFNDHMFSYKVSLVCVSRPFPVLFSKKGLSGFFFRQDGVP